MCDFEIEITDSREGYLVAARSAAGESGSVAVTFPFDDRRLEQELQALELALVRSTTSVRRLTSDQELPVQRFGRHLFDFAFPPEVRAQFMAGRQQSARDGKVLRVRLRVEPSRLAALPWEFLYDPRRDDYLCLSTPLVRYLDVLEPRRPMTVTPPLRILAMVARPDELEPLDVDHERRRLAEALAGLEASGRVELRWVQGQTWWDLEAALDRGSWHVFHFIGHGAFDTRTGEGVLGLATEDGALQRLGASDLALLLESHRSLRLVVLNSCQTAAASAADRFSSTAAALMRRGIPAVVAMQYEISDPAAIAFARGFYTALAVEQPVDLAVTRARRAIKLDRRNSLEWATPVLYLRAPTGALFELRDGPLTPPGDMSEPPDLGTAERTGPEATDTPAPPGSPDSHAPVQLVGVTHDATVRAVAFSRDGTRLVTASRDGTVRVVDPSTGREHARLHHRVSVFAAALCPQGTMLASASADVAQIWDLRSNKRLRRLVHDDRVWGVAFSPDGTRLATASHDRTARVWDTATGVQVAAFFHAAPVGGVAFSPDGIRLATACDDRTARVWDVGTETELVRVRHDGPVSGLSFSPDGSLLATASSDATARVWTVNNGRELVVVRHDGPVNGVAFSPNRARLATASHDRTARVWQASSGQELMRLQHDGAVWGIAFSPDGTRLATASHDTVARIWKL